MSETETYTLAKEPIDPEKWVRHEQYYYKHVETGEQIHAEAYRGKMRERRTLAEYLRGFEV